MEFTEPRIVFGRTLKSRSYIIFYLNNQRVREYNGKRIGKSIFPNTARTITERNTLLESLRKEIHQALILGEYSTVESTAPGANPKIKMRIPAKTVLKQAYDRKLNLGLSETYQRDLRYVYTKFLSFLTKRELKEPLEDLSHQRIEQFLATYKGSNTYYMNKRTDLAALFSTAGKILETKLETVKQTDRRRQVATLHIPYTKEELNKLFKYLKETHFNLYLCCLLVYATLLRPHIEIRQLRKRHFMNGNTEIHLSGEENKGGNVRVSYVPEYAQVVLQEVLPKLGPEDNIFSGTTTPYNTDYFKTIWGRMRKDMLAQHVIRKGQTIYSVRHTAALEVYTRTRNITTIQRMMAHTSVTVTQRYLRGLGEVAIEELIDSAPRL